MDRVRIQVQFKKFWWTCPKCRQEDYEDAKMEGGNTYEHTCSKCEERFNQSNTNLREYNGVINYTPEEYETLKSEDLSTEKSSRLGKWVYEVKNPPAYVEPSKEDLERELADKQADIAVLESKIAETTKEVK